MLPSQMSCVVFVRPAVLHRGYVDIHCKWPHQNKTAPFSVSWEGTGLSAPMFIIGWIWSGPNWTPYLCLRGPKTFSSSWISLKATTQMYQADSCACFLSLARGKLRLCSANHRLGYYSEQETENGPRSSPPPSVGIQAPELVPSTLVSCDICGWVQSHPLPLRSSYFLDATIHLTFTKNSGTAMTVVEASPITLFAHWCISFKSNWLLSLNDWYTNL